jgi:hypothetical protein
MKTLEIIERLDMIADQTAKARVVVDSLIRDFFSMTPESADANVLAAGYGATQVLCSIAFDYLTDSNDAVMQLMMDLEEQGIGRAHENQEVRDEQ